MADRPAKVTEIHDFWQKTKNNEEISQLNKTYRTFKKIVRGYESSIPKKMTNFREKTVFSLYKGPLSDKKVLAGLFNDSGEILDLFESN